MRAFGCIVCLLALAAPLTAEEPQSWLAPQAVSAVDISPDGKIITVGTMAFSHDANVWQFGPDGGVLNQRRLPPFAPMQVATLADGKSLAVGLAYSRVTSPEPTVWLGPSDELLENPLNEEFSEADTRDSELARWRTGSGGWRDGWLVSQFGELFVSGPDWVFKPPTTFLKANGERLKLRYEDGNLLPTSRASRMAASRDGRRVAFGWLTLKQQPEVSNVRDALSVWQVQPNRRLWAIPASTELEWPELPNPAADYPELARTFRLQPDALLPGTMSTGLAVNRDGSRVAVIEHAVWCWQRKGAAIGKWDPPIHVLNFVPRQRGRLRVFDGDGQELCNVILPEAGQFEIGFGPQNDALWCWPAAWFARGVNGSVWLPTDPPARTLLFATISAGQVTPIVMPDTVSHAAVNPQDGKLLVSTRNGSLSLATTEQTRLVSDLKSPARVAWSSDGRFAVAGTADGRLARCNQEGIIVWDKEIPAAEAPVSPLLPSEVVPGLPIYQGGRIPGGEHAYVGDIWVIRSRDEAVLVDCGGTSGFATTRERLRSLGIQRVTHILHTHSHGDHCGGAYLWQAGGTRIVAPRSAELTLTWLMPMLTDYGIFPPRRVDDPLPLQRVGDECEFTAAGQCFRAVFVPGHSFDLTVYLTELNGKRIAFTGDLGFENQQDILHRCWDDADKAREVLPVIRDKVLGWKPDIVFTGHGVRTNGTEFLAKLVEHTEKSLAAAGR
jgi:glyoxylase-like metal-dependent hydrolase (beta-lactamase superfamily II)